MHRFFLFILVLLCLGVQESFSQSNSDLFEAAQKRRDSIIAALPSKATVKAMFKPYRHKTGQVFDMFPVGFKPKQNKGFYDKVTIWHHTYTARYRETNAYGINSLVIEFYDSGRIRNVTVLDGTEVIYTADYRDAIANKPYSIITESADWKYSLHIQRPYNIATNKVEETISYHYLPLNYDYDEDN